MAEDRAREMASLWIEFAANGNIRFWTRDPNTAVVQWGAKAGDYAYAPTNALQSLMDEHKAEVDRLKAEIARYSERTPL